MKIFTIILACLAVLNTYGQSDNTYEQYLEVSATRRLLSSKMDMDLDFGSMRDSMDNKFLLSCDSLARAGRLIS